MTPPLESAGDANLEITLNGHHVLSSVVNDADNSIAYGGSSPVLFHYYLPTLELLEPLTGPHLRGASVTAACPPSSRCRGGSCRGNATPRTVLRPPAAPLHRLQRYCVRTKEPLNGERGSYSPHMQLGTTSYDGSPYCLCRARSLT